MQFYFFLLLGFLGGIPAGMGMGGGTVTIPLLVFLGGVQQKVASCANLFAFLPMSLVSLRRHKQNGLLKTQGVGWLILPALVCSALGAFCVAALPNRILQKAFGLFLIVFSVHSVLQKSSA